MCLTAYLMSINVYGFTLLANRRMCSELCSRRSLRDSGYENYDTESGFNKKTGGSHINHNHNRKLTPKTHNQRLFSDYLAADSVKIVVCGGPAGSGKTYLSCGYAVNSFRSGVANKIIMTRPTITVENESIGFLPGTMEMKMNPYIRPLLDALNQYYSMAEIDVMFEKGVLEIVPLGFMRGRTFTDSVIIADEMQNSTPEQLLMLVTRIGENSKMVITGDAMQSDIKGVNGLSDFMAKLNRRKGKGKGKGCGDGSEIDGEIEDMGDGDGDADDIKVVIMEETDVVRSRIVKTVLRIFKEDKDNDNETETETEVVVKDDDVVVGGDGLIELEKQYVDVKDALYNYANDTSTNVADDEGCVNINIDNDCAMIPYKDFMISKKKSNR